VVRQCQLLGLARSSLYYQPRGESERNLHLLRLLDEQYTRTPFYGVPKMTEWLRRHDRHCQSFFVTFPWHYYKSKPTRRNRYVILNCFRYRLVWI
jgi:hypothetical protein